MMKLEELEQGWYDWTMKGGSRPAFMKKRVAYYVTGAEEWKYADSLAAIAVPRTFFLSSPGNGAVDVFQSGWLVTQQPAPAPPDGWTYDPLDNRPGEAERGEEGSVVDQSPALNLFGQGLVYHTAPFGEDSEISGFPRLSLWLALLWAVR